jgi:hypothetical protein
VGREAELLVSDSVHVNVSGAVDADGYGLRKRPERASISAVRGYGAYPPFLGVRMKA